MIHDINVALSKQDYCSLAALAADFANKDTGHAIMSATSAQNTGFDFDFIDLVQYLSDGALDEVPCIGLFRRYLLIEKGYEKCGHFFKARLAEFDHIMPKNKVIDFGYNHLHARMIRESSPTAENLIQLLRQEAAFQFFHGMACPAYREIQLFDLISKIIPSGHALDYASANADVGLYAALHGYTITTAQVSGPMVEALKKRFRLRKLSTELLPIEEHCPIPELKTNHFEMIFANNSLQETNDPLSLLEEFRIALKSKGGLVINRYPFEIAHNSLVIDTAGRRKAIQNYIAAHFEPSSIAGVFKKI
tara:strand:- start:113085 stop:114002 length:918 start_codon:yes stop_codon:yes gene_type:complete